MEIIPIQIIDRQSKLAIGKIDLPSFCIDHMKMTSPESNAKTMRNHIEKKCRPQFSKMYINNREVSGGILANDLNFPTVVIEIE
jgi:hypothetical protein